MRDWDLQDVIVTSTLTALTIVAGLRLRKKVRQLFGIGGITILDVRDKARLTDRALKYYKTRDPAIVNGITLHQMGFSRGSDPSRYLRTTAHWDILPDGTILWLHGPEAYLPAADGLSRHTESIEFAGNLPGRSRSTDPADYWAPDRMGMNQLTPQQVVSGRYLVAKLQRERGYKFLLGHIQGEDGKPIDPGPDIWGAVGAYGVRSLGMSSDAKLARFGKVGGEGSALPPGTPGGQGAEIPDHWWAAEQVWRQVA